MHCLLLQFAPSYSDYVLYSDGGPADNVKRKKFRGQKGAGGERCSVSRLRHTTVTAPTWHQQPEGAIHFKLSVPGQGSMHARLLLPEVSLSVYYLDQHSCLGCSAVPLLSTAL
jgi:hypothetical protein